MSDKEKAVGDKPELVFADLPVGRRFRPLEYHITKELLDNYIETVGDMHPLYTNEAAAKKGPLASPIAPPGLAAIYARLSYLQDHTMPSGGVLVKQEFHFLGPMRIGDTLKIQAEVDESYIDKKERNRVNFLIKAENRKDEPISAVRLYLIWPK